jgi:DNA-binding NarL/FixJ family response regulator
MSHSSVFHNVLGSLTALTDDERLMLRVILDHDNPSQSVRAPLNRSWPPRAAQPPTGRLPDSIEKSYALLKLPPFRLTERELEVLRHLAAGSRNKEVARQLSISPRTVEVHRARIMEKLGAKSAANLAEVLGNIGRG